MQAVRHSVGGCQRRHVDDAAAAHLSHGGNDRFAAVPNAFDVHRHRGIPISFANRIETATLETAVKRCVIDEAVDAAKRVERGARHLHCRSGAGNIELGGDRCALFAPQEIERVRAIVDIGDHHTGAEARKISRIFLTDAARGAGDDDDLSFHVHGVTASA